jgi:hypothetical protein
MNAIKLGNKVVVVDGKVGDKVMVVNGILLSNRGDCKDYG